MSKDNDDGGIVVDFSDVEIEEEIIDSGAIEDNTVLSPMEQFQNKLPPAVNDAIDKFQRSYAQHRKQYLIGLAIIGIIALVAVCAVLLYLTSDSTEGGFNYKANVETFRVGPFIIPPGDMFEETKLAIEKPDGDLALHQIDMIIIEEDGTPIPSYTVYDHMVSITNQESIYIAGEYADSLKDPALRLPLPYVLLVDEYDTWDMNVKFVNLWGIAAHAVKEVYVEYTVYYSEQGLGEEDDDDISVGWTSIGERGQDTADCLTTGFDDDLACKFVYDYSWDQGSCNFVSLNGHLHIGGINMTLEDVDNEEVIAFAIPVYDVVSGYILSISTEFSEYSVSRGTLLRLTSYYDKDHDYENVVSLFQVWGSFPSEPLPDTPIEESTFSSLSSFEEEVSSSPSPSPSAILASSSSSPSPSTSPSYTSTPSESKSSGASASSSKSRSLTSSRTSTSTPTPSKTPTGSISKSLSKTPTGSISKSPSKTPSVSVSQEPSASSSTSAVPLASISSSFSRSSPFSPTPSASESADASPLPSPSASISGTVVV